MQTPTALVTGGAERIGRAISLALHQAGYAVVVHYHRSAAAARALVAECNQRRPDSARAVQADLGTARGCHELTRQALQWPVGVLVNNAAVFRPTPIAELSTADWDEILGLNLRAPLELARGMAEALQGGSIINITDIYAHRPLQGHLLYCISQAGLTMCTQALALELAPGVRVNAVAPGAILPPAGNPDRAQAIRQSIPLGGMGTPEDIAGAVLYLVRDASYLSGQTLILDGGRLLPVSP